MLRPRGIRAAATAGLFGALLLSFPVHADEAALIHADPWEVIHIAREFGRAEVGRDAMKDPEIRASADGVPYRVVFYGCSLGRACDTILFEARLVRTEWDEDPPRADIFARWNSEKLFGRALLDGDNRAVLDHPVTMVGGVSKTNLRDTFRRWRLTLQEFADRLDF